MQNMTVGAEQSYGRTIEKALNKVSADERSARHRTHVCCKHAVNNTNRDGNKIDHARMGNAKSESVDQGDGCMDETPRMSP